MKALFGVVALLSMYLGTATAIEALMNGANDIIVVKRSDGSFASTKWEAQVGKVHSILQSREGKPVHVFVNNVPSTRKMVIGNDGEVVFKDCSSNQMTSSELASFNLKRGKNTGKYICDELEVTIEFNVFLYQESDKLVFTDIDGTITQSDIKGQVYPLFGITAVHKKVVELFDKIRARGYHIIYLTARSFAQDVETKNYLFDMLQNQSGYSLPIGPVMLSPESFINSLISEVYDNDPDVLKTEKILGINSAFTGSSEHHIMDSVVSAYGNKDSDVKAYVNSEIDLNSIYIVNPEGVLENVGTGESSSYEEQVTKVDKLYPVVSDKWIIM